MPIALRKLRIIFQNRHHEGSIANRHHEDSIANRHNEDSIAIAWVVTGIKRI